MTVMDKASADYQKLKNMIAYDGTVDRDVLVLQTKTLIATSSEMLFEAGKRLCVLKETLPHGEFQKALNEIGLEYRTARNIMNASLRLSGNSKVKSISLLGQTKIYDLALLDDDYLKELDENGTIAGVELDEYDRMTTRELRKAVRKLNKDKQGKEESYERLLKNEQEEKQALLDKIDSLEKADNRSDWGEVAELVVAEIHTLHAEVVKRMGRLFELSDKVSEISGEEYSTAQLHARQTLIDTAVDISGYVTGFTEKAQTVCPAFKPGIQGDGGFDFNPDDIDFEDLTEEAS